MKNTAAEDFRKQLVMILFAFYVGFGLTAIGYCTVKILL